MPEKITLSSEPINQAAIRDLKAMAAAYERIGRAQAGLNLGFSKIRTDRDPVSGRYRSWSGSPLTIGGAGSRTGMISAGGLPFFQGNQGVGNISAGIRPAMETARLRKLLSDNLDIGSSNFARARERQEYKSVERQLSKDLDAAWGLGGRSGGGGGGGRGGGGRGGIGGGGQAGRFRLRDRLNLGGGIGIMGSLGGPWIAAGVAVAAFASLLQKAASSLDALRRASLITGGTMQQVARLQMLGINASESESLRQRMSSDPWTIMNLGFAPDPRLGGPQNNTIFMQRAIERLRQNRSNPDRQLQLARQMGLGEDSIRAANLGEGVYQETKGMSQNTLSRAGASRVDDTVQSFRNRWQKGINELGALLDPKAWSWDVNRPGGKGYWAMNAAEKAKEKGPGSLQGSMEAQTQATMQLISVMKQTQRDFYGRGMQDRGALPNAIFGSDLMKGIRAGRIRMGAFR